MEKYLIVNADDFGLTPSVCEGILDAHEKGIVSSTTSFVNRKISKTTLKHAKLFKNLGIGIHLNITTGAPLTASSKIKSLMDKTGQFRKLFPQNLYKVKPVEIWTEWLGQIKEFERIWGRLPTHLDSHHHVHAYPKIWKIFWRMAKKFQVPFRLPRNQFVKSLRQEAGQQKILLVDRVWGNLNPKIYWTEPRVKSAIKKMKKGSHELVCHPAYNSKELQDVSSFNKNREQELKALTSKSVRQMLEKNSISLINYNDLKEIRE